MFIEDDNNNELNISIDDLFKDPEPEVQPREETSEESQPNMTKAVSERINTVRRKTEVETQDRIAKELGYSNYVVINALKTITTNQIMTYTSEKLVYVCNKA